jgi:2-polyprenyl-3-methyl-5-hydroxy-6-metoxy-1,4-benzoquinol methylase
MDLENIGILSPQRSSLASEQEHERKIVRTIACCSSVVDLGAGGGKYSEFFEAAFDYVRAYDGTPAVAEITNDRVHFLNLGNAIEVGSASSHEVSPGSNAGSSSSSSSNPQLLKYDVTFCIEVAEHLPESMEATFIANLGAITKHFLVISWSPHREDKHLNPKTQEDVISSFHARSCWEERAAMSSYLKRLSTVSWIKENVLVFQKIGSCE